MVVDPRAGKRRKVVGSRELTRDALSEILLRFSVEDLQSFCRIGAGPNSIVKDPYFVARYERHQRDRGGDTLLIVSQTSGGKWNLLATTVHKPESTSVLRASPNFTRQLEYSSGLFCSGAGHITTLFNPMFGASRTIPPFPVDQATVKTYLGFDVSSGRFKIFGVSKKDSSDLWGDPHIYTLEHATTDPWRPLACTISYTPFPKSKDSKSISIGGLLFYPGQLSDRRCTLMHLDLASECFGSNPVPEPPLFGQFFMSCGLLDVKGQPAICFLRPADTYRLWILKDINENVWCQMLVETPQIIQDTLSPCSNLSFEGLTRCGELVFLEVDGSSLFLHSYNAATETSQKKLIHQSSAGSLTRRRSFWSRP